MKNFEELFWRYATSSHCMTEEINGWITNRPDFLYRFVYFDANLYNLLRQVEGLHIFAVSLWGLSVIKHDVVTEEVITQHYKLLEQDEKYVAITTYGNGNVKIITADILRRLVTIPKEQNQTSAEQVSAILADCEPYNPKISENRFFTPEKVKTLDAVMMGDWYIKEHSQVKVIKNCSYSTYEPDICCGYDWLGSSLYIISADEILIQQKVDNQWSGEVINIAAIWSNQMVVSYHGTIPSLKGSMSGFSPILDMNSLLQFEIGWTDYIRRSVLNMTEDEVLCLAGRIVSREKLHDFLVRSTNKQKSITV